MGQVIRIGMDTSKRIFQLHGVNAAEQPVLRRQLGRGAMIAFFERLPPTVIGIEACGVAHHWARLLTGMGHDVKLIAPQLAKPYVKRGKNDAADAEALCEAMSRPSMRSCRSRPRTSRPPSCWPARASGWCASGPGWATPSAATPPSLA